eukprot:g19129.t1
MVRDRKVLSFVVNRAHMLYKMVSEPPLALTNVQEATLEAVDAVDHVDGCAGEPLSNVEGGHLGYAGVEYPFLGADVTEMEELGVGDCIPAG